MADTDRLAKELAGILRSSGSRQTKAYDTPAVVRRVDGSTAWVHIPGGVDETPVQLTVAAEPGDTVQVRVSGGTAWIVGNASAPPTDDKAARAAQVAEAAETLGAEARQTARAAAKIAGDTEQHFWFTETGADTGAHITEKTQEDFLADPDNGGGNLLARSNGIALREGMIELATLQQSGMDINTYTSGGTQINIAHLGYGPGTADGGGTDTQPYYTIGKRSNNSTVGNYSMAEGKETIASGARAHAEGNGTHATGNDSHSEGRSSIASGDVSHTEGSSTASGDYSHAEGGGTVANGIYSHSQGYKTIAAKNSQTAIGMFNAEDTGATLADQKALIIGNGTAEADRRNALTVDWGGIVYAGATVNIISALTTLGWSSAMDGSLLGIQATLEKILDRLSLFGKQLTMSNNNWSSGTCTVTDSSKYMVFLIVQGGGSLIAYRDTPTGTTIRGDAISGNATSGNYNQYARAFGATTNGDVWTHYWSKQLSHVTSSGYHTSGTEQAVTAIYGLIPKPTA